ncbi:hypothetical protein GGI23_003421, partial [Coemansia sp. RSA 2559]
MSSHDANKAPEQGQQDQPPLSGFLDMDMSNNPISPNAFGNFPFPLSDQASLFNFHAPMGLGADPMYPAATQGFFTNDQTAQMTNPTVPDDLAVDLALLGSMAQTDPLSYATASSLLYAKSMAGSVPDIPAQAIASPTATPQQQQQQQQHQQHQQTSSQDATGQMATRVRAARARILNNVLYNMSLGGIQQLDGYNHGSLAVTASMAQGAASMPAASQASGMSRFLADAGASASLGIPSGQIANSAEPGMPGYSMAQPDISAYTMGSTAMPLTTAAMARHNSTAISGAPMSSAATAPSIAPLPRIEQACKMCRRRKVRCDGRRPSCTFCANKKFECVYEPVVPGGRKRGRRSKASDAGSLTSSNAMSAGPQMAAMSVSDSGDRGSAKHNKQPRLGRRGTPGLSTAYRTLPGVAESPGASDLESPEGSDMDSGESSADDDNPKHNYLEALSNRQIALPDNVDAGVKLQDIMDTRADIELAEGVAAAALASIATSPLSLESAGNQTPSIDAAAAAAAAAAATSASAKLSGCFGTDGRVAEGQTASPLSLAERHMQLYFTYFHPQHPILHRTTFEKSVRNGTVTKVLWHAVQAIAARYGPSPTAPPPAPQKQQMPDNAAAEAAPAVALDAADESVDDATMDVDGSAKEKTAAGRQKQARRLQPNEFGRAYAELVRVMLPEATRTPTIEVIQALYLLSEHKFGMGDWLEGSTYWGTAVRMFNQLQLHMTDEAFQFPAYTSHLGLHESAVSPLTCKQSPANYANEMRKPTLNNETWIRREMERRMRWVLFESERMHSLAGGSPPLVTLEAGWVHMPCSDALWELAAPRRAAEYERLLLHMGRYYVDTGGSLRIEMAPDAASIASSQAPTGPPSANELSADESSDPEKNARVKPAPSATSCRSTAKSGNGATAQGPRRTTVDAAMHSDDRESTGASTESTRRKTYPGPVPNRVASMLVSIRRRKNRIHLNAHSAIVIGQMTRARLALFRLFFPCRWPSQLMANSGFSAHLAPSDRADLGGGGGAPGPVVLGWDERFRRLRITISDIEAKLMQWRVYLESMFPLREHEEGSGRTDDENDAIHRERVEYANYRFLLSALIIQNRSTVLQLQACLARRERKIRCADQETTMGETARQTLANHILPNQPSEKAMRSLRAYGQECWMAVVRQACEIEDLLESHWQVRPHSNQNLHVMIKPDWHAPNAIKAKINAETNLRRYPEDPSSGQRPVSEDVTVYFSHESPPYPLLVVNQRLLEAIVKSANKAEKQIGAELTLASSMNSNIHIETNANARDMGTDALLGFGARQRAQRKSRVLSGDSATNTSVGADANASSANGGPKRGRGGKRGPKIPMTEAGEVDFEAEEDNEPDDAAMDPFRRQQVGTSYFIFLAAKTMIMYLHHAKMSAYILARRKPTAESESSDSILRRTSISVDNESMAAADPDTAYAREGSVGAQERQSDADALLMPDFTEDLQPPPQLKTLSDIRRMQDRVEV